MCEVLLAAAHRALLFVQCHKELGNISEATNWAGLALTTTSCCDEALTDVSPAPQRRVTVLLT